MLEKIIIHLLSFLRLLNTVEMAVELAPVASAQPPTHEESGEDRESLVPALPPPDRGPAAWKFLFGIFTIEAVLWGMG